MASAELRKELDCSVCLNIYTDPVMLKCGHNFCRNCIVRVLDTQQEPEGYSCPECRVKFKKRPTLQRNITLSNIVEKIQSTQPDQKQTSIFCTYCIHSPVPAIKSCLHCEASLCDNHLKVHSKAPEHVFIGPTSSLENRKCSIHKEVLKYYCSEDASSICVSCRLSGEHRDHPIETLDEASESRKKKLRSVLQKLIAEKGEIEKIVQSQEGQNRKLQGKADAEKERVIVLFANIRRQLENLEKKILSEISKQVERLVLPLSKMIQELELEKDVLSRKIKHIEDLCHMTDSLVVLQESDREDLCDDGDNEDTDRSYEQILDGGDLDLALISHVLRSDLSDIMLKVNEGVFIRRAANILLDENTAYNYLLISDDGKTASWTYESQNHPETPARFQWSPQVLSSSSFCSGRHYWEVDVSRSDQWRVGMCYTSIARRGNHSAIGDNDMSWCLYRWENQYLLIHNGKEIQLPGDISVNRVRIYLDYDGGHLSFYELDDMIRHLHTFIATFTEPLHAAVLVWRGCIQISGGNQDMEEVKD
ncbi:E3 ubiquitin-protein ligase TRIM39-like [Hyperolius riggenbachi]|uniref:E3 ubiquitin-protein ligase TRIM39-like n=1 Tax=Hyperolius riggenbachi TaxID=752182 RepID=UPI0035A29744